MGMFSWKTSDTKQSIRVGSSRPVYLLQPGDLPAIEEPCYQGYGEFGGVDAHVWLARMNVPAAKDMDHESQRLMGIAIEFGGVLKDVESGDFWHIINDCRCLVPGRFFAGRYDDPIPDLGGASANDLVADKRLVKHNICDLMAIRYPLKFSFNSSADYESLPAAVECPDQGFL